MREAALALELLEIVDGVFFSRSQHDGSMAESAAAINIHLPAGPRRWTNIFARGNFALGREATTEISQAQGAWKAKPTSQVLKGRRNGRIDGLEFPCPLRDALTGGAFTSHSVAG